MSMVFEGHIYCWHIYGYRMVNKNSSFLLLCAVMWYIYIYIYICVCVCVCVEYSSSALGDKCAIWVIYLFRGICQ